MRFLVVFFFKCLSVRRSRSFVFPLRQCRRLPRRVLNITHIHTCAALRNHGGPTDEASPEENSEKKREEQGAKTTQTDRRERNR